MGFWLKEASRKTPKHPPLRYLLTSHLDQHGQEGRKEGCCRGSCPKEGDEGHEGQEGMSSKVRPGDGLMRYFQSLATCTYTQLAVILRSSPLCKWMKSLWLVRIE